MVTISQMTNFSVNSYSTSSSSTSTDTTSTILRDYASIKNGSYKKLLKAYYKNTGSLDTSSISTSTNSTSTIAKIQSAANDLVDSADILTAKGNKSLFKKTEVTSTDASGNTTTEQGYNMDTLYKAVSNFVNDYNTMIEEGAEADSKSILKSTLSLTRLSKANKNLLSKVGITIGSDNKLAIDEETFKSADISGIRTLFNGSNSYAATVSAKASKINSVAVLERLKSNTYTGTASYSNTYSSGNIFSDFF